MLHEDSHVLVVDKPAGLLTVPTEAREKDTLWSRALHYLQHRYGGRPYAGIVHRLDKDTSGAVVFARSRAALHALQARFREHAIDREYVALVEGGPPDAGTLDADLVREPGLRRAIARPGQEGRRAVTRFRTLERFADAAMVSVQPETGRTHQIRVHLSAAGYPILGDRVYGREVGERAPRPRPPGRCCTPESSASRTRRPAGTCRPSRRCPRISRGSWPRCAPKKEAARQSRAAKDAPKGSATRGR